MEKFYLDPSLLDTKKLDNIVIPSQNYEVKPVIELIHDYGLEPSSFDENDQKRFMETMASFHNTYVPMNDLSRSIQSYCEKQRELSMPLYELSLVRLNRLFEHLKDISAPAIVFITGSLTQSTFICESDCDLVMICDDPAGIIQEVYGRLTNDDATSKQMTATYHCVEPGVFELIKAKVGAVKIDITFYSIGGIRVNNFINTACLLVDCLQDLFVVLKKYFHVHELSCYLHSFGIFITLLVILQNNKDIDHLTEVYAEALTPTSCIFELNCVGLRRAGKPSITDPANVFNAYFKYYGDYIEYDTTIIQASTRTQMHKEAEKSLYVKEIYGDQNLIFTKNDADKLVCYEKIIGTFYGTFLKIDKPGFKDVKIIYETNTGSSYKEKYTDWTKRDDGYVYGKRIKISPFPQ